MSSLQQTLVGFIEERISSLLRVPEMWGSEESVELQLLQLLEIRWLTLTQSSKKDVGRVQKDYVQFLRAKFPGEPPETLAALLARQGRSADLTSILQEFVELEREKTRNALERYPSGLRLFDDKPGHHRPPRHPELS